MSGGREGGCDLFREEGEAGSVVGDLGEVEDRVRSRRCCGSRTEPLGDLVGSADEGAVGEIADLVVGDVLWDVLHEVRADPGQPSCTSLSVSPMITL